MQRKSRVKRVLAILLLAVFCIGGTELLVCRFADPALYERIVSPVRRNAMIVWDAASEGASIVWGAISDGAEAIWDKGVSTVSRVAGALQKNEATPLEEQGVLEPEVTFETPLADPAITSLKQRDGRDVLTGGSYEIYYFNQGDPIWCDQPYGNDTIGKYGCGPSALAMAVSSLTGQATDPVQMAQWAVGGGYWARHGGSYLSIVNGAAGDYGLQVESVPDCDADRLLLELSSGKIAVALMTKGHFTNSGHFILLRGATLDGGILVADPNSRERSLAVWDAQLIIDELSKSRNNGAPLWFLSPEKE